MHLLVEEAVAISAVSEPKARRVTIMRVSLRIVRIALLLAVLQHNSALAQPISEADVKAAMILNFVRFTLFPNIAAGGSLSLCVSSKNPGIAPLQKLDGRLAGTSVLKILTFDREGDFNASDCQVAVYAEVPSNRTQIVKLSTNGTLTIGNGDQFLEAGGIIGFLVEENRIRFAVENERAKAANLQISSKVLALARENMDGKQR